MSHFWREFLKEAAKQLGPEIVGGLLEGGHPIEPSDLSARKLVTALQKWSEPQVHALETTLLPGLAEQAAVAFLENYEAEVAKTQTTDQWRVVVAEKVALPWSWRLDDLTQTFWVLVNRREATRTTVVMECRYARPDFFGVTKRAALARVKRLACFIDPAASLHRITGKNIVSYV